MALAQRVPAAAVRVSRSRRARARHPARGLSSQAHGHSHAPEATPAPRGAGHSHNHGHSHAGGHGHSHGFEALGAEYSDAERAAAGAVTWAGIAANVVLSAAKLAGGLAYGSMGLLADAVHSASDLFTDFVTLFTVRLCSRPADERYPFGYGKWESLCTLLIGVSILYGAWEIGVHAVREFVPAALHAAHAHAHGGPPGRIDGAAAAVAAVSIVAKEALYQVTQGVAQRLDSRVLAANAWHHRTDAATSVLALAGIVAHNLGARGMDQAAAVVTCLVLSKLALDMSWGALGELMDTGLPPATNAALVSAAE
eukprot:CAMPEP_0183798388 /NCGR_PEP_ID=MMETSP0803_2-20130417/18705_1 /TAXON_ID=195967 /ORGANISM="Crustomastix stigmata, Strain CCMP3273" /LENGTH=310 /DNA_ID=CAMNT_0026043071 /DNA_START=1 /DNA_END=930 /DNA_ORIENTATION=+